eukprot:GHVN01034990.1.p1 GENE.GHVN01034990.1~~GHVN01034990.1.p1  ORF type:complete len:564 (-),score=64.30 GHVN01034990.1:4867-6558(-)
MLRGASNDAHLFALTLINIFHFNPHNIVLLTDALPSSCYQSGAFENEQDERSPEVPQDEKKKGGLHFRVCAARSLSAEPRSRQTNGFIAPGISAREAIGPHVPPSAETLLAEFSKSIFFDKSKVSSTIDTWIKESKPHPNEERLPTRQNIMIAVNWMVKTARQGDVIVLYYAGHGCQVDNMNGWEGEGYDEAIVPIDGNADGENNVITMAQLKKLLLSVAETVQLTIILDCNGGQTILDPTGTGTRWQYIKGVKQKGLWPFITDPTDKMNRAKYDSSVWKDKQMYGRLVRPRFIPGIEVSNTDALIDPTFQKPTATRLRSKSYLLAGAPFNQCALEALLPSIPVHPMKSPTVSQPKEKRDKKGESRRGRCSGQVRCVPTPGDAAVDEFEVSEAHADDVGPSITPAGVKVIHGVFTWSLVAAIQDMVVRSFSNFGMTDRRMITYSRLIPEVLSTIILAKKLGLHRLDQAPELTFHSGGAANPSEVFLLSNGGRPEKSSSSRGGSTRSASTSQYTQSTGGSTQRSARHSHRLKEGRSPSQRDGRPPSHLDGSRGQSTATSPVCRR